MVNSWLARNLKWLGLIGLIPFSFWVLSPWINPSLSWVNSYVSELSVSGQPAAILFQLNQLIGAACLCAYFIIIAKFGKLNREVARVAWILATASFGAVINTFAPMQCSPYLSKVCMANLDSFHFGATQYVHEATSIIIFGGLIVAHLMLAKVGSSLRIVKHSLLWGALAFQAILNTAIAYQSFNGNHWIGVLQRISLLGFEAWLVFAIYLFSEYLR